MTILWRTGRLTSSQARSYEKQLVDLGYRVESVYITTDIAMLEVRRYGRPLFIPVKLRTAEEALAFIEKAKQ